MTRRAEVRRVLPLRAIVLVPRFVARQVILTTVPGGTGPRDQEAAHARTRTDGLRPIWLGDDPVLQLREWASDKAHVIPDAPEAIIGAHPSVDIRLVDPKGSVSRRHGRLVREERQWVIEDLHSHNGIGCDGARAPGRRFLIVPGMEIRLGSITLVAENATLIRLRDYLARVLGWDAKSRRAIDLAMRAIRATANRWGPLTLLGTNDLVAVARQIHLRTMPAGAAFVVCGPRGKREADVSVRVTASTSDVAEARHLAAGGTICVRANRLPAKYDELVEAMSEPYATAQLFLCASQAPKRSDPVAQPVVIPSLAQRSEDDLHRIVSEYTVDAARELGVEQTALIDEECKWLVKNEMSEFADIEIATLRFLARDAFGNVSQAASRLGLSHVGLGKWFKVRGFAT